MFSNAPQTTIEVELLSPTDHLPSVLSEMSAELLQAHIDYANSVIAKHQEIARNGESSAERYYFFIPQVAKRMGDARYTLSVVYAEMQRRDADDFQPLPPSEEEMDAHFAQLTIGFDLPDGTSTIRPFQNQEITPSRNSAPASVDVPKVGIAFYQGKKKPYRAYFEIGGETTYVDYFEHESEAWHAATARVESARLCPQTKEVSMN